jgi:hypothetical protein
MPTGRVATDPGVKPACAKRTGAHFMPLTRRVAAELMERALVGKRDRRLQRLV